MNASKIQMLMTAKTSLSNAFTAAAFMLCNSAFAEDGRDIAVSAPKFDATQIMTGTNTGGVIRVNYLLTLEWWLDFFASSSEVLLTLAGIWMIFRAVRPPKADGTPDTERKRIKPGQILWGAALITLGLSIPGTVNWFFASARDMSYFS